MMDHIHESEKQGASSFCIEFSYVDSAGVILWLPTPWKAPASWNSKLEGDVLSAGTRQDKDRQEGFSADY